MEGIEIRLDRALFSAEAVARTAHRYTDTFFAHVREDGAAWVVVLSARAEGSATDRVREQFETDALDECLRECVRAQTQSLHDMLVAAALREALSPPSRIEQP